MFADSFLETSGMQRSRRNFITLTSFTLQAALVTTLIIFPLLHPEALPVLHRLATPVSFGNPFVQHLAVQQATHSGRTVVLNNATVYRLAQPSSRPTTQQQSSDEPSDPPQLCVNCIPGIGDPGSEIGVPGLLPTTATVVMPAPPKPIVSVIRISHMDVGSLLHRVEPAYPPLARAAHIQGTVMMSALIGKNGAIENLRVLSGHPMLTTAAIEAVRQWRYRPYILNGEPVEVETQITVNFSLSGS
jgi:periplasmic protein TonB